MSMAVRWTRNGAEFIKSIMLQEPMGPRWWEAAGFGELWATDEET